MADERPKELCPGGDRASVVAKKRGNARGVKGGRKVERLNKRRKENSTVNDSHWVKAGKLSFPPSISRGSAVRGEVGHALTGSWRVPLQQLPCNRRSDKIRSDMHPRQFFRSPRSPRVSVRQEAAT
jgi:hypothetical protein